MAEKEEDAKLMKQQEAAKTAATRTEKEKND